MTLIVCKSFEADLFWRIEFRLTELQLRRGGCVPSFTPRKRHLLCTQREGCQTNFGYSDEVLIRGTTCSFQKVALLSPFASAAQYCPCVDTRTSLF